MLFTSRTSRKGVVPHCVQKRSWFKKSDWVICGGERGWSSSGIGLAPPHKFMHLPCYYCLQEIERYEVIPPNCVTFLQGFEKSSDLKFNGWKSVMDTYAMVICQTYFIA
jgi:hypothetical protein